MENLVAHGGGYQTEDFVHVSDAVDSTLSAINPDSSDADIFDVGTSDQITINGLVDLLEELLGKGRLSVKKGVEDKEG